MPTICPCQTHAETKMAYATCCEPFHLGNTTPQTAEQLMRSRYSAYVLQDIDYIVATSVPAQQQLLDVQAITSWAKQTDWAGLQILKHNAKVGKRHAIVEFKAFFNTAEGIQAHHELSAFVRIIDKTEHAKSTAKWYFIDPTVNMTVSQKQPCICGSDEKFKRCCGQFLS